MRTSTILAGLTFIITAALLASPCAASVVSYSVAVGQDNPIGYWRLDDPAGSAVAADSSGNNRDLVLTAFDAGQHGQPGATGEGNRALRFRDGKGSSKREDTAEYVGGGDGFPFASNQSFSFEYWIKVAPGHGSGSGAGVLSDNYDQSQNRPWYLSRLDGGGDSRVVEIFTRNVAGTSKRAGGTTNVVDNQWHHVVGIYDSINAQNRLYVDGGLEGSVGGVPAAPYGTNVDSFILGNHLDRRLDAWLDEVAMYDKALDDINADGVIDADNRVVAHFEAASVPEPAAVLVWSLLAGLGIALARPRRATR